MLEWIILDQTRYLPPPIPLSTRGLLEFAGGCIGEESMIHRCEFVTSGVDGDGVG